MAGPIGGYLYSTPGFGGSAVQPGVGKPVIASWPSTTIASSATIVAPPPLNLDANSGAFAITGYAAGMAINMPLGSGTFRISSGAPASPAVTWDPSNMDTGPTLSNGNLTASTATTINQLLRGTASNTAGYFEQVFSSLTGGSGSSGIGFLNASETFANHYLGHSGSNSIGYYPDGTVFFNGVALATGLPTFAAGDILGAELTTAPSIKFYKNGTLVYTSTSVPSGSLYPGLVLANNGDIGTAGFGAKLQTYLPAGVTAWDGSQAGTLAGMSINLAAGSGSFAITGYGASLIHTGKLAAGSGAFAITGNAAGMSVGLPAGSGAFAYTGYAAGELVGEPAGSGLFAITGRAAAMSIGMPLGSGPFAITGYDAALNYSGAGPNLAALSGSFIITGYSASFNVAEPAGSGGFAIIGHDASMVPGQGGILVCTGDPITETAIVAANLLMFRRKYPLSAQPKNTARSLEVPLDALIRREEPDFARERRRQPEYDFTNHTFEADPSNRGAYEAH